MKDMIKKQIRENQDIYKVNLSDSTSVEMRIISILTMVSMMTSDEIDEFISHNTINHVDVEKCVIALQIIEDKESDKEGTAFFQFVDKKN